MFPLNVFQLRLNITFRWRWTDPQRHVRPSVNAKNASLTLLQYTHIDQIVWKAPSLECENIFLVLVPLMKTVERLRLECLLIMIFGSWNNVPINLTCSSGLFYLHWISVNHGFSCPNPSPLINVFLPWLSRRIHFLLECIRIACAYKKNSSKLTANLQRTKYLTSAAQHNSRGYLLNLAMWPHRLSALDWLWELSLPAEPSPDSLTDPAVKSRSVRLTYVWLW